MGFKLNSILELKLKPKPNSTIELKPNFYFYFFDKGGRGGLEWRTIVNHRLMINVWMFMLVSSHMVPLIEIEGFVYDNKYWWHLKISKSLGKNKFISKNLLSLVFSILCGGSPIALQPLSHFWWPLPLVCV